MFSSLCCVCSLRLQSTFAVHHSESCICCLSLHIRRRFNLYVIHCSICRCRIKRATTYSRNVRKGYQHMIHILHAFIIYTHFATFIIPATSIARIQSAIALTDPNAFVVQMPPGSCPLKHHRELKGRIHPSIVLLRSSALLSSSLGLSSLSV
jgi:hypothetical protein